MSTPLQRQAQRPAIVYASAAIGAGMTSTAWDWRLDDRRFKPDAAIAGGTTTGGAANWCGDKGGATTGGGDGRRDNGPGNDRRRW
jgi:hypothetical protein